jgi:hypothetical protein
MCSPRVSENAFISAVKYSSPPISRMCFVEKFVCRPEPFQSTSPPSGFGWKLTSTP